MAFLFFSIIVLLLLSLLFIIEDIQVSTIYIYYITAILLFIIYYFYYKKKWQKNIFIDNYIKYKKEIFKSNFSEDFLINKFSLDLNEKENEKPIFTKVAELISILMVRFGFTLPIIAAISGSTIVRYDGMIYFCVYLILFIIPYFMKLLASQVVFYKFIKQIEKEENVTIYNGKLKTLNSENK
ncbi:hypothetical protein [Malaciobacter molluscorum]|uniref:hypothetical protein n=1 Tax=Malaciobacter molluscorum TaxID=1032072 RepID=UPI00100B927C|nr:hypothetical protein [Malaciobacter molluscorum]